MKVLMVCLGNICRSPLAEGILRVKVLKEGLPIEVDSAGTSAFHIGSSPDKRMCATAKSFGINIDKLKARQFETSDFDKFDIIFAMDQSNYSTILLLAKSESDKQKVKLILNEIHPGNNLEVPDPYYGGEKGFYDVYNLLNDAMDQFIKNYKSNG